MVHNRKSLQVVTSDQSLVFLCCHLDIVVESHVQVQGNRDIFHKNHPMPRFVEIPTRSVYWTKFEAFRTWRNAIFTTHKNFMEQFP